MTSPTRLRRKTISIEEAASHLGISRGVAYEAAHRFLDSGGTDGLPVLRLGRRMVVPVARLEQMLGCSIAETTSDDSQDDAGAALSKAWSTLSLAPTGTCWP